MFVIGLDLAEVCRPFIKMIDTTIFQHIRLKIPHHRVKLAHRIRYRRFRGVCLSLAACDLVHILGLHKQIEGTCRTSAAESGYIVHLCRSCEILVHMTLINENLIKTQLLEVDEIILDLCIIQLVELVLI